jgi:hypothetical protein
LFAAAGSPSFIQDIRKQDEPGSLGAAIENLDTPALYGHLIRAISFQGISDRAASAYIEQHGSATWIEIAYRLSPNPSCPKLRSYWHYSGCGYSKSKATCACPEHIARCPVPKLRLRSGRLNQAAFSLFLFMRDVMDGDLVNWIDGQLDSVWRVSSRRRLGAMREALLGPLRNVYATGDKTLSMGLADLLLAAQDGRTHWHELGGSMIAVDSLVHAFLHRAGILRRFGAQHSYGAECYEPNGCAEIIERVARRIDAREFNQNFPRFFPRFVQHAIWRFCAQDGLNICNGVRIKDRARCQNIYCRLYPACDRVPI